ncbi:MAG: hypothetical protein LBJ93_00755 [Clostridiales bacterium]|jgi:hypothetical protein|nr:hypothetical protein [Clostridiales bacterium]
MQLQLAKEHIDNVIINGFKRQSIRNLENLPIELRKEIMLGCIRNYFITIDSVTKYYSYKYLLSNFDNLVFLLTTTGFSEEDKTEMIKLILDILCRQIHINDCTFKIFRMLLPAVKSLEDESKIQILQTILQKSHSHASNDLLRKSVKLLINELSNRHLKLLNQRLKLLISSFFEQKNYNSKVASIIFYYLNQAKRVEDELTTKLMSIPSLLYMLEVFARHRPDSQQRYNFPLGIYLPEEIYYSSSLEYIRYQIYHSHCNKTFLKRKSELPKRERITASREEMFLQGNITLFVETLPLNIRLRILDYLITNRHLRTIFLSRMNLYLELIRTLPSKKTLPLEDQIKSQETLIGSIGILTCEKNQITLRRIFVNCGVVLSALCIVEARERELRILEQRRLELEEQHTKCFIS